MGKTQVVSLLKGFLLTFTVVFLLVSEGAALGRLVSQVPPPAGSGPYPVGWINREIPRTGGETLQIRVHYPATTLGVGAEPNTTAVPYPTLVFSPGFGTTVGDYSSFATTITSWGFVCTLVGSNPQSTEVERKNDLIYALNWLDAQNDNSSFKLGQIMDESKFGVIGHSLGGAAAIRASASEARFKVSIPIAPFLFSPAPVARVHIPILIMVGSRDSIAPPNTMSQPAYEKGNTPKFLLTLEGVNHNTVVFMGFKYIISFLKLYLCEGEGYARYLYGTTAQQEIENGKIKLMYDLKTTTKHKILCNSVQYTILVYSDSTVLNTGYNQILNQMNLAIAGPPDTRGTANITVPKQLAPENHKINVYFNGEQYSFTLTENASSYFVFLTYNHSQHQVTISFTIQISHPFWREWWFWTVICVAVASSVAVAIFRIRRKSVSSVQDSLDS